MHNPNAIPNYIVAASPSGLRRLMLITAVRKNSYIKFFDIQFAETSPGRKQWVAWYLEEISDQEALILADPADKIAKVEAG